MEVQVWETLVRIWKTEFHDEKVIFKYSRPADSVELDSDRAYLFCGWREMIIRMTMIPMGSTVKIKPENMPE